VKAVDNNVVWIGGTRGDVLRTTNGGNTWVSVGGGALGSATVSAVEALDPMKAFVSTYSASTGRIFRTTNAGASWSPVLSQSGVAIGGIQMKTALEGYAVGTPEGGKWKVYKTSNGGSSWDSLTTGPVEDSVTILGINYYGPFFMRPRGVQLIGDTLWFGSPSGIVYRSTNLGAAWSVGAAISYLTALHFNSSSSGIAGSGIDGVTSSTVNGGTSWDSAGVAWTRPITSISGSGTEFWATTGSGIAYSNNNGMSWSFANPGYWGIFAPLNAVSFSPVSSPLNGWAVGDTGMILHYQRSGPTAVEWGGITVPGRWSLEQNYPNPFNPTTTIRYALPQQSHVTLSVYNVLGQEVVVLVNEVEQAGYRSVTFDGSKLSSGMYFYRIKAGDFVQTRKLILVK
jgi:photosystem II stability/assembly factor-like uncharacterized protein